MSAAVNLQQHFAALLCTFIKCERNSTLNYMAFVHNLGVIYYQEESIMLSINKNTEGKKMTLALEGRLDTSTAPELEAVVKNDLTDAEELVFDFEELEYVSSAGLRVLLLAQKMMKKKGGMVVRNASKDVMEVFKVTGFAKIFKIE